jgi:hypothetical protein
MGGEMLAWFEAMRTTMLAVVVRTGVYCRMGTVQIAPLNASTTPLRVRLRASISRKPCSS